MLRELAKSNLSNSASAKSKMLTPNPSNLSEKGTARKGADESQECVIEDLEKGIFSFMRAFFLISCFADFVTNPLGSKGFQVPRKQQMSYRKGAISISAILTK